MKKTANKGFPWKVVVPVAVVLLLVVWFVGMFNGLISAQESVDSAWSNVESVYQRRADLIPNLVETVKGYKIHEAELLTDITKARSAWASAVSPDDKMAAADSLDNAFAKLMVVVENYPDLKASQNFLALQDELAGSENRINVARQRYNDAVRLYNVKIRRFPANIIAGLFGFEKREMFKASSGAEKVPEVKF